MKTEIEILKQNSMVYYLGLKKSNSSQISYYQPNNTWVGGLSTAKKYKTLTKAYKNLVRLQKVLDYFINWEGSIEIYTIDRYRDTKIVDISTLKLMNII